MAVQGGRESVGSCHIATRFPYTIISRILRYPYHCEVVIAVEGAALRARTCCSISGNNGARKERSCNAVCGQGMIDRWYSNPGKPENLSARCVIRGLRREDLQCYLTKIQGYGTLVILEVKAGHRPKMLISPHNWCFRIVLRRCSASRAGCHGWS